MRLMTIGINAEMAAIGSHFFKKVRFKLDRCYNVLVIIFLNDYYSVGL
jgi:hypothetical protein